MIRLKFLCHPTPDWQNPVCPQQGQRDIDAKRGCEKFLLCLIDSSRKLFAPSNECLYSFLWPSEETQILSSAQRRIIKTKITDGHSTTTAETYKLWDRPVSRILHHNVCNAGFPRSQANARPRISAEYAQRSITVSIYHKISDLSSKNTIYCVFYIFDSIYGIVLQHNHCTNTTRIVFKIWLNRVVKFI